eukprot:6191367-Pleurochrysis_carterae.AAC.2
MLAQAARALRRWDAMKQIQMWTRESRIFLLRVRRHLQQKRTRQTTQAAKHLQCRTRNSLRVSQAADLDVSRAIWLDNSIRLCGNEVQKFQRHMSLVL